MRLNASDLPSTILVPPNMTVYYVTGVNTELEYLASSTAWERRVIELMNELVQDMPQQYSEQYLLTQLYYVIKRIGDAHTLTLPAWVHDESAHPYLRKRAMKLLTYNTIGMAMSVNRYGSEDPFPSLRWSDDEDPAKDSIPEWGIRVIPTLTAPDQYIAPTRYTSTALFTFLANRSPAPQTLILFDGACKASTRPEYMNVIEYYEAKKAALAHGRSKLVLIAGGTRRGHRVPRGVGARSKRRLPDK